MHVCSLCAACLRLDLVVCCIDSLVERDVLMDGLDLTTGQLVPRQCHLQQCGVPLHQLVQRLRTWGKGQQVKMKKTETEISTYINTKMSVSSRFLGHFETDLETPW